MHVCWSQTDLGHDANKGNLADVRAFASHVGARAYLSSRVSRPSQVGVVGHKGLLHECIQHRVAPLDDVYLGSFISSQELWPDIPAIIPALILKHVIV